MVVTDGSNVLKPQLLAQKKLWGPPTSYVVDNDDGNGDIVLFI